VALAPGDVLVFYTDGLVETIGRNGEEFGVDRLAGIVFRRNTLSALELQEAILDEVHRFRAEADSADDVTLMLVRVK
jgi:serine phosphatase RsbU (regulator of sigma subunit)